LVRLAIPSSLTLLALLISDAFSEPIGRPALHSIRPIVIKLAMINLCWAVATKADYYGFLMSLMLVSTSKLMFESDTRQPQGAGGTALPAGQGSRPVSRTLRTSVILIMLAMTCLIWWEMLSRRGVNP
jgi:hypothetical protein